MTHSWNHRRTCKRQADHPAMGRHHRASRVDPSSTSLNHTVTINAALMQRTWKETFQSQYGRCSKGMLFVIVWSYPRHFFASTPHLSHVPPFGLAGSIFDVGVDVHVYPWSAAPNEVPHFGM
eukprot:m.69354 g.69354  ORF g.69354 m.69354 type:complete len:122 (+) comp18385_c0_seq6:1526-1891(+)